MVGGNALSSLSRGSVLTGLNSAWCSCGHIGGAALFMSTLRSSMHCCWRSRAVLASCHCVRMK